MNLLAIFQRPRQHKQVRFVAATKAENLSENARRAKVKAELQAYVSRLKPLGHGKV